jgi:hypothetical protein
MLPVNDAKRLHSLYMLDLPDNREENREYTTSIFPEKRIDH